MNVWRLMWLEIRSRPVFLVAWLLGLWLVVAGNALAYPDAFPAFPERAKAVAIMQEGVGTRVLYGVLPSPGTLGQLLAWEPGSQVALLAAVAAILLGTAVGRGAEDSGTAALVRASGVGRRAPLLASLAVLFGMGVVLGGGIGGILAAVAAQVPEYTVAGGLLLGAWVAAVFCALAVTAFLAGEVLPTRGSAIAAGFSALGAAYILRIVADFAGGHWLTWLTPFGWRDLISPYTHNQIWPLGVIALMVTGIGIAAGMVRARRDLGAGLVEVRTESSTRLNVRHPVRLFWALGTRTTIYWASAVAAVGAIFGATSGSLTESIAAPGNSGTMAERLAGGADPATAFATVMGLMLALPILCHGIIAIRQLWSSERAGHVALLLTHGRSRTDLAASAWLVAFIHTALVALAGALPFAALSAAQLDGVFPVALLAVLGRLPGIAVAMAVAAALVAWTPRYSALIWLPVAWTATVEVMGSLIGLPTWARSLSFFGVPAGIPATAWSAALMMVALGGGLVAVGGLRRRDLQWG